MARVSLPLAIIALLMTLISTALGVVCLLIWLGRGFDHTALVNRETLLYISGYVVFLLFAQVLGFTASLWKSVLTTFALAASLLISFAVDVVVASVAVGRQNELRWDGPGNDTMRASWTALSLRQKHALQNDLRCCGFASPADDPFQSKTCLRDTELPGCHQLWKTFLETEAAGVSAVFFSASAMHGLLLLLAGALAARAIRNAAAAGASGEKNPKKHNYYGASSAESGSSPTASSSSSSWSPFGGRRGDKPAAAYNRVGAVPAVDAHPPPPPALRVADARSSWFTYDCLATDYCDCARCCGRAPSRASVTPPVAAAAAGRRSRLVVSRRYSTWTDDGFVVALGGGGVDSDVLYHRLSHQARVSVNLGPATTRNRPLPVPPPSARSSSPSLLPEPFFPDPSAQANAAVYRDASSPTRVPDYRDASSPTRVPDYRDGSSPTRVPVYRDASSPASFETATEHQPGPAHGWTVLPLDGQN